MTIPSSIAGTANLPVHWSTAGAAAQCISLRLAANADGNNANSSWTAPLDASLQGGAVCHLMLPGDRSDSSADGGNELDVHGPRVARGLQLADRCITWPELSNKTQLFDDLASEQSLTYL